MPIFTSTNVSPWASVSSQWTYMPVCSAREPDLVEIVEPLDPEVGLDGAAGAAW